ncbi:hypothetical protein [Hyalangium gracile]|uniref:hypothetical protein n=1 Tax=Hyalangium gracile TaxID=394092 RepID=UPI001CCDDA49|nr:hypothetical protein [Hyalangium gracile]
MVTGWLGALGMGLTLVTAATPPSIQLPKAVCTLRGACITLPEEERMEGSVSLLHMEEKLPRRIAADGAFGLWLAWPMAAEQRTQFVHRSIDFGLTQSTPAGHFELFVPSLTLVRREAGEEPALLAHVSFDPTVKAPLAAAVSELVADAQARGLLTSEQQQVLTARQKALEGRLPELIRALDAFRAKPADPKARATFLSTLAAFPGEEMDLGARAIAPETFLTPAQRTELRKAGHEVQGRRWLEYSGPPSRAYRLHVQACSVEQLVREWNAGLRGPSTGIEALPRPALDFDRAHRHDDVSFTLDVRNDEGITRMDQVLQRLLELPGVRRAPGPALPPPR